MKKRNPLFLLALLVWSGLATAKLKSLPPPCEEIFRIGTWAYENSESPSKLPLDSDTFIEKVAQKFLEKWDPLKIVFIEKDVVTVKNVIKSFWKPFLVTHNCDVVDKWEKNDVSKIFTSFQTTLTAFLKTEKNLTYTPKKNTDLDWEEKLPKYNAFAKNETERTDRIRSFSQSLLNNTSEIVFEAYQKDPKKLIEDTLLRLIKHEKIFPLSRLYLLKSFLAARDPYANFFPEEELSEFSEELLGSTSGIGVKVRLVPSGLLIESIVPNSAAEKSKQIEKGDIIKTIDGYVFNPEFDEEFTDKLKGKVGSRLSLVLLSKDKKEKTVNLVRSQFQFEEATVTQEIVPVSKTLSAGVIKIPSFYGNNGSEEQKVTRSSAEDTLAALKKIKNKVGFIILDLRGNPGGFLEEAVRIAGFFIGDKAVVSVMEKGKNKILRANGAVASYLGPLVVLIDGDSASASEVIAGAFKDQQRALILGSDHSYAKGTVQKLFDNVGRPGTAIKITTSLFYSPNGHSPANGGVIPHYSLPSIAKSSSTEPVLFVNDNPGLLPMTEQLMIQEKEVKFKSVLSQLNQKIQLAPPVDLINLLDVTTKNALGLSATAKKDSKELGEAIAVGAEFMKLSKK